VPHHNASARLGAGRRPQPFAKPDHHGVSDYPAARADAMEEDEFNKAKAQALFGIVDSTAWRLFGGPRRHIDAARPTYWW
jgi:hypothetical protein